MITLDEIKQAHQRIKPYIHHTPVLTCHALNELTHASLYFKCENFQKVGAFKARGACNVIFSLADEEAKQGVLTHSSGNHAAAVAYAAQLRGIPAYIVMPTNAPRAKIEAVKHYGGQITFCEPVWNDREKVAKQIQHKTQAHFIPSFNDERIMAGQGTAALELLDECPDLAMLVTPVGGGGLLSGCSIAATETNATLTVIGAEPYNVRDAQLSLINGEITPIEQGKSCCDGLLTLVGDKPFAVIRKKVSAIYTAKEETIKQAQHLIWSRMKIVVEPSSAVVLAIMLENPKPFAGKRIGLIVSGGNVDVGS